MPAQAHNSEENKIHELPKIPEQTREIMRSGDIYFFSDSLGGIQLDALELVYDFNQTRPSEQEKRRAIMNRLFEHAGEALYIEPPLHANWGINTSWGDRCYANFNLTLVDDGPISIGDHTMLGPNVTLVTTGHPIKPELRLKVAQYSMPIVIENNVWIGAGVTVLPGVTIGENSVVGAGSVVTNDIPANSVAYGTPCKVVRQISDHDDKYYWRDRLIPSDIPPL